MANIVRLSIVVLCSPPANKFISEKKQILHSFFRISFVSIAHESPYVNLHKILQKEKYCYRFCYILVFIRVLPSLSFRFDVDNSVESVVNFFEPMVFYILM